MCLQGNKIKTERSERLSLEEKEYEKIENTLQSIDSTLKRIEEILIDQSKPKKVSINISERYTDDLIKKYT